MQSGSVSLVVIKGNEADVKNSTSVTDVPGYSCGEAEADKEYS